MHLILEIQAGPASGPTFELRDGQIGQVGSSNWSDFPVPTDPTLSGVHFLIECGPTTCRLRDLNSPGGTWLNGSQVISAEVRDGDRIVAGQTHFVVRIARVGSVPAHIPSPTGISSGPAAGEATPRSAASDGLLRALGNQGSPLYALLDAARDPGVMQILCGCEEEHQSLYEGEQGEQLAAFAPHLVRLPDHSSLLETLVLEGWGQSWGVYLTGDMPFQEIRKHFRRFLMVELEAGRRAYFRFYDPRVLRVFLPGCTPQEASEFFGPVASFMMESPGGEALWTFARGRHGVEYRPLPLAVGIEAQPTR